MKNFLRILRRKSRSMFGKSPRVRITKGIAKERHGSEYGGWVIKENSLHPSSIVYSFGIGKDISFDLSIIDKYDCIIHAFDPTPEVKEWLNSNQLKPNFKYHDLAVFDEDTSIKFYQPKNKRNVSHSIISDGESRVYVEVPAQKITSIMKELNHKKIDLLKMDIEGAEYRVLKDILKSKIQIDQILIEFHHFFESITVSETEQACKLLDVSGYKLFYISPNGFEFSFCKY